MEVRGEKEDSGTPSQTPRAGWFWCKAFLGECLVMPFGRGCPVHRIKCAASCTELMDMKTAEGRVKEYFDGSGFPVWPRFAILARLQEEIAEIGRIISVEEGLREEWKVDNMDAEDEFGDAFFQLIHLANQCGVDADAALRRVFRKYDKYRKKAE